MKRGACQKNVESEKKIEKFHYMPCRIGSRGNPDEWQGGRRKLVHFNSGNR